MSWLPKIALRHIWHKKCHNRDKLLWAFDFNSSHMDFRIISFEFFIVQIRNICPLCISCVSAFCTGPRWTGSRLRKKESWHLRGSFPLHLWQYAIVNGTIPAVSKFRSMKCDEGRMLTKGSLKALAVRSLMSLLNYYGVIIIHYFDKVSQSWTPDNERGMVHGERLIRYGSRLHIYIGNIGDM